MRCCWEKSSAARCQQIPIEFKDVTHTGFSFIILFLLLALLSLILCPAASSLSPPLYTVLYLCRRRRVSIEPLFIATSFNRADFDFLLRPSSSTFSSFILSLPPTTTPTPTRIDITSFLPALDTYASDWPPTTTHL